MLSSTLLPASFLMHQYAKECHLTKMTDLHISFSLQASVLWSVCLQEAVRIGYVPEEVDYAVSHYKEYGDKCRTPLDFLQLEWHERKMMIRNHIGRYTEDRGMKDVGTPSLIEARDCLVECGGNMEAAIALCALRREEKVSWHGGQEVCLLTYV